MGTEDNKQGKDGKRSGRFPANICHDGSPEVMAVFPQTKISKGGHKGKSNGSQGGWGYKSDETKTPLGYGDSGSAARYFKVCEQDEPASRFLYTSKARKKERNAGLEGMVETDSMKWAGGNDMKGLAGKYPDGSPRPKQKQQNHHPTVKPLALMRYLCRLSRTPTGGVVLDPFMGSGTTGKAAILEGREFIGIELDPEYFEIAKKRIATAQPGLL